MVVISATWNQQFSPCTLCFRYLESKLLSVDVGIGWASPDSGFNVKGVSKNGVEVYGPRMINGINAGEAYSFHTGGALFLFADGSIHFLEEGIDPWLYVSFCTRDGSELVKGF